MCYRETNREVIEEMSSVCNIGWTTYDAGGHLLKSKSWGVCYYSLYEYIEMGNVSRLFILQTPHRTTSDGVAYADYIINRSQFKDAFLTKSVGEALEYGFEVDCDKGIILVKGAIAALRATFEMYTLWPWKKIVDLGFSEDEAYALSVNCSLSGGNDTMCTHPRYYMDHQVHLPMYPYNTYVDGVYAPSVNTVKSGGLHGNIQLSWGMPVGYKYNFSQEANVQYPLSRKTLENLLQTLKEL